MTTLTLLSHHLCPYVQRAAIALTEKQVAFERIYVDLADKPDWFTALSPLGKVPLLKVSGGTEGEAVIFESAVILEFLEDTQPPVLHPRDALARARHRSWIEFGSTILNGIARFYSAAGEEAFEKAEQALESLFQRVEDELGDGSWFAGKTFSLVDAVYAPIFRYFDSFDRIGDFAILTDKPRLAAWRQNLNNRPSVRTAVAEDYTERLENFLHARNSELSRRLAVQ